MGTGLWWGHLSSGRKVLVEMGLCGDRTPMGTQLHGDGAWRDGAPRGHISVGMGLLWDRDPWVPVSVGETPLRWALRASLPHPDPRTLPTPPPPSRHPPALIGAGPVLGRGAELPGAEPAGARGAGQHGR